MQTSQKDFWVTIILLICKVTSVKHIYLFNFYLSNIKYKRPEVNREPAHFLTFINDGKAFSSLPHKKSNQCLTDINQCLTILANFN